MAQAKMSEVWNKSLSIAKSLRESDDISHLSDEFELYQFESVSECEEWLENQPNETVTIAKQLNKRAKQKKLSEEKIENDLTNWNTARKAASELLNNYDENSYYPDIIKNSNAGLTRSETETITKSISKSNINNTEKVNILARQLMDIAKGESKDLLNTTVSITDWDSCKEISTELFESYQNNSSIHQVQEKYSPLQKYNEETLISIIESICNGSEDEDIQKKLLARYLYEKSDEQSSSNSKQLEELTGWNASRKIASQILRTNDISETFEDNGYKIPRENVDEAIQFVTNSIDDRTEQVNELARWLINDEKSFESVDDEEDNKNNVDIGNITAEVSDEDIDLSKDLIEIFNDTGSLIKIQDRVEKHVGYNIDRAHLRVEIVSSLTDDEEKSIQNLSERINNWVENPDEGPIGKPIMTTIN